MDIRTLTETYSASPQIEPSDMHAIAQAGFSAIICNRPDSEIPSHLSAENMRQAAEAAGLQFDYLPITHQTLSPENVAKHADLMANANGPVLAYCASGTRSSILWALSAAGKRSADEILQITANAGYDLSNLRGALG